MKILFVGNIYSLLLNELISRLMNEGNEIWILDFQHREYLNVTDEYSHYVALKRNQIQRNPILIFRMFNFIRNYVSCWSVLRKNRFDICAIHYTHYYYFILTGLIKRNCRKLVCSIYGSDFYKTSPLQRVLLTRLFEASDGITFANETTKAEFNDYYQDRFARKTAIYRFGISHLEMIDEINRTETRSAVRERLLLPVGKTIITCGYGRSSNNQHEEIIAALLALKKELLERIFLIIPMSYGNEAGRIQVVENLLSGTKIPNLIIKTFVPDELMCSYVVASDIFINVPKTDQLNAAMQEMLYAGNKVINGGWLPYGVLDTIGIKAYKVASVRDLTSVLEQIMENGGHAGLQENPHLIRELSAWESTLPQWKNLYFNEAFNPAP